MKTLFFHNPILFRFFPDALNTLVTFQLLNLWDGHRISPEIIQIAVDNQFVSRRCDPIDYSLYAYEIVS